MFSRFMYLVKAIGNSNSFVLMDLHYSSAGQAGMLKNAIHFL